MSETSSDPTFSNNYEALNFEKLRRQDNYRTITYREDILHILDKKEAAAIVYQIIYRWLDWRRGKLLSEIERRQAANLPPFTDAEIEDSMWVYMSYQDFVNETGGALSYNTVGRTLNYLIDDKKVIQRRRNRSPVYRDKEYRINKDVVAQLLSTLPTTPFIAPRGMKYQERSFNYAQQDILRNLPGKANLQTQEPKKRPKGYKTRDVRGPGETGCSQNEAVPPQTLTVPPQNETLATQNVIVPSQNGTITSQIGAISQVITQITSQEDTQQQHQHQQSAIAAAPPSVIDKKKQFITKDVIQSSEEEARGDWQEERDAKLTPEQVVSLFEEKHGVPYEQAMRTRQLRAASSLLNLERQRLEEVYDECYDEWWRERYGMLHVHHLIEVERSTGQKRITRILQRLAKRVVRHPPEEKGSTGGWERFKQGSHEDDNLDDLAQRYRDRGLLEF